MTERNKDDQIPTSETEGKQPFGQQTGQQPGQKKGTPPETGEAKDAETLTQAEQPAGEADEKTESGFVASKKDDESGYVQGERKGESEGSKNFGTNGE